MHTLEKHVVLWLEEWKVGLGLMGEQGGGGESIQGVRAFTPILTDSF